MIHKLCCLCDNKIDLTIYVMFDEHFMRIKANYFTKIDETRFKIFKINNRKKFALLLKIAKAGRYNTLII